jgi:hypothetical protein
MRAEMLSEIIAATELCVAQRAFKWFIAGVGCSVAFQVFKTGESFWAVITNYFGFWFNLVRHQSQLMTPV